MRTVEKSLIHAPGENPQGVIDCSNHERNLPADEPSKEGENKDIASEGSDTVLEVNTDSEPTTKRN